MSDITDGSGAGGSAESSGTSRSASSTPRPARGQLWRHRLDRIRCCHNLYQEVTINANALVLGTLTVSDFVRENTT